MPGLFADSDYRRLYSGHIRMANWAAIVAFAIGMPVLTAVMAPNKLLGFLLGLGISAFSLVAVGATMSLLVRRQVTHVSRSGDTLTIGLLGLPWQDRSFTAPIGEFSGWSRTGVYRVENVRFEWRGQRYTMPLWDATYLDPEGFGELDPALGASLAARGNAERLRKGR